MAARNGPLLSDVIEDLRTNDPEMLERITRAAEECFRKYGIQRTRMDDVASRVGLARPNLYRFVPSKDTLILLVNLEHTAKVDAERRRRIPIKGPVGELIVRSLVMGVTMARADEFDLDLIADPNVEIAARLLAGSQDGDPVLPRPEYWYPILEHGRARGEVRDDLSNAEVVRWLGMITLMFLKRPEVFGDESSVESYARRFVVPALLVPAKPVKSAAKR